MDLCEWYVLLVPGTSPMLTSQLAAVQKGGDPGEFKWKTETLLADVGKVFTALFNEISDTSESLLPNNMRDTNVTKCKSNRFPTRKYKLIRKPKESLRVRL